MNISDKIEQIFSGLVLLDSARREEAEHLLSTIKDEDELEKLILSARKEDFKIRYYVIKHIAFFEYNTVIKALVDFLFDESSIIQRTAERGLDDIKSDNKYDFFIPLINSENKRVRMYAIKSLGRGEQTNAVLPLLKAIYDSDVEIRVQVIDALRLIGDTRGEKEIMNCLRDSKPEVRYASAFYCGSRKLKKSCSLLFKLLEDQYPRIRFTCVWALGQIKNDKFIRQLPLFLEKEKDKNVRNEIFSVMREAGMVDLIIKKQHVLFEIDDVTKPILNWTIAKYSREKKLQEADICLFVEGSYPYVAGGVSSWVHELLNYFKDMTFSIVHMVASRAEIREFKYNLPSNIIYYKDIYLYELPEVKPGIPNKALVRNKLDALIEFLNSPDKSDKDNFKRLVSEIGIMDNFHLSVSDILFSYDAWNFIREIYETFLSHVPFLEYIWSYRALILPVYNILKAKLPPASLFYTVLTGYAGLGAVLAKIYYDRPMMLTEHGIYHRERMIEINQASWIYEIKEEGYVAREIFTGLKKVWIGLYRTLSSLVYNHADTITSLFKDNAALQIEGGADERKIVIIPNGIDISGFEHIKEKRINKSVLRVTLVGRVVPIKDIKTYIWSARVVADKMPGKIKFLIMGPYDEDKDYADECFTLKSLLGLDEVVEFTGNVNLREAFQNIDLVVLTSVSEGQPLSLMEAMSSGIPCVATNVGCCKELLYGKDEVDENFGKCGIITNVHSPNETANAIMTILKDSQLYQQMGNAGKIRMKEYYQKKDVFQKYGVEFEKLLKRDG